MALNDVRLRDRPVVSDFDQETKKRDIYIEYRGEFLLVKVYIGEEEKGENKKYKGRRNFNVPMKCALDGFFFFS